MNAVFAQNFYTPPQQLPPYLKPHLSGKLLCLTLQSSFKENERWVSKQLS